MFENINATVPLSIFSPSLANQHRLIKCNVALSTVLKEFNRCFQFFTFHVIEDTAIHTCVMPLKIQWNSNFELVLIVVEMNNFRFVPCPF